MHRWKLIGLLASAGLFACVVSCQPNESGGVGPVKPDPSQPVEYKPTPFPWKKPANFPEPIYKFSNNPLTVEGVALGRALFYDDALSANGTVSCAFCHQQSAAFGHTDHALSHGINDKIGTRNVPAVQNAAFYSSFFWDGGVVDLDLLPINPIENPVEMGHNMPALLNALRKGNRYRPLFQAAFGSDSITSARFLKAMSQFMLTMVSANSRYDKYVRKEAGGELTPGELSGLTLFKQKCAGCHAGELFTDQRFRNNGLSRDLNKDEGRSLVTLRPEDKYMFRVPSLRNVDRTPPYMHDGRFWTLDQVLDHYTTNLQDVPELDPLLRQNQTGKPGISLTVTEKQQIIAFLRTLTDTEYISDRRLGPPTF
ncbi:cytochrome-c peroxidase [Spirosoma montaniterrae]|uniref:Cytochrome-c peroxidase n=1 Tax=Spirosoma montaniterrae TaxID=1178516 RepID=A0A1P9WWQ1_9BACT|nr:cytochrome c peroxidase [Spirosoma montaniterrae]AQG79801.1 cytochrome-c peroxidase [Spirosoma montaniterrae]